MVIISMFRHFTEYRKSPGGLMFDRWQNFLKISFLKNAQILWKFACKFLRVESISEVYFEKKNQFQEKFQEMDFLEDF